MDDMIETAEFKIQRNDVFRINDIGSNVIYVFGGGLLVNTQDVFSKEELDEIKMEKTKVHMSKYFIYKTDSIGAIKSKIVLTIKEFNKGIILDENNLYLFVSKIKDVNVETIYRKVTKEDSEKFTHEKLLDITNNIVGFHKKVNEEGGSYSYEQVKGYMDVPSSHNNQTEHEMKLFVPLGMDKLYDDLNTFTVNPLYNKSTRQPIIKPDNSRLLLEYLPIVDIFVCLKLKKNMFDAYFPKSPMEIFHKDKFDVQDVFHKMYHSRKTNLPYEKCGIREVSVIMNIFEDNKKLIPLGEIFKNIHVTENMLMMNYNPGSGKENVLRLYSNAISTNGKVIPLLKIKEISVVLSNIKLTSANAKVQPLQNEGVIIKHEKKKITTYAIIDDVEIFIHLYEYGKIKVKSKHELPMSSEEWDKILQKALNPFIEQINIFLRTSGFSIKDFVRMKNEKIENMIFSTSLDVKSKMTQKSLIEKVRCITHIFDVFVDKDSNITMRFKDVKSFNKHDAQILLMNSVDDNNARHKMLIDNYRMTNKEATDRINKYNENERELRDGNINFQNNILVLIEQNEGKFQITVKNITSIDYLCDIQIYLDCILRITQEEFMNSTYINYDDKMCSVTNKRVNEEKNIINIIDEKKNIEEDENEINEEESVDDGDENYDNIMGEESPDDDDDEENYDNIIGEESPDDNELIGGNDSKIADVKIDEDVLIGQNIGNYFSDRREKKDEKLFVYETQDGFTSYSRLCESNLDRQPVVISNDEKLRIDANHNGSYTSAIEYGSDPQTKNWFICPRYWCLLTNSSLTEEEVKSGVCGGIIGKDKKKVPKGAYVYEFDSGKDLHHEKNELVDGKMVKGKYVHNGPGFLKQKNPSGNCLPCCFKLSNSKSQQEKTAQCTGNQQGKKPAVLDNKYIEGYVTMPLDKGRWGFLTISVQKFLNTNQQESQMPKNPSYILPNKKCFLRYGVENSNNQSFIACISEIYSYKRRVAPPTILDMKKELVKGCDLDTYLRLNNGSIVNIFKQNNTDINKLENYLKTYENTQFLQTLDTKKEEHVDFIMETISSYENYLDFILDDVHVIDHTYLWGLVIDIIKDLNLVIIELVDDDITDNISLICPTNSHKVVYDERRETMILLKKGVYYEPIYQYFENNHVLEVQKSFTESTSTDEFRNTLKEIEHKQLHSCSPVSKKNDTYSFKKNIVSAELMKKLNNIKYVIKYQVSNYQSKCIGFYASKDEKKDGIFVPCSPSALTVTHKIKYMDDSSIWHTFAETVKRLRKISELSNRQIKCLPSIIVQDDMLFVGMLTETNQFVQFSSPEITVSGSDLPIINKTNYNVVDKIITSTKKEDSLRVKTMRKISLEQQFYAAFRTLGRLHMNDYENRNLKIGLIALFKQRVSYKTKLKRCIEDLHNLLDKHIMFGILSNDFINSYTDVTGCMKNTGEYCIMKDGKNILIIPERNLLSQHDNKELYFGKLADELVRNRRTKLFLLDRTYFVTVPNTQYKVNKNELLIVESLLNETYFKNMKSFNTNPYVQNVTYDVSDPYNVNVDDVKKFSLVDDDAKVSVVDTKVSVVDDDDSDDDDSDDEDTDDVDDSDDVDIDNICESKEGDVTGNAVAKWKFESDARETHYGIGNIDEGFNLTCGFNLIGQILTSQKIKVPMKIVRYLKDVLCKGYSKYYGEYANNIIRILKEQGKIKLMGRILKSRQSLCDVILSDDYYLTDLDIWLICEELNLPVILFTSKTIKGLIETNWLYLSSNDDDFNNKMHFIRTSSINPSNTPVPYSLISPAFKCDEIRGSQGILLKSSKPTDKNRMNFIDRLQLVFVKKHD